MTVSYIWPYGTLQKHGVDRIRILSRRRPGERPGSGTPIVAPHHCQAFLQDLPPGQASATLAEENLGRDSLAGGQPVAERLL